MKRITFFLIGIFCLTACNNEIEIEIENNQEATPQLKLFMSDSEDVSVYSTATVNECRIDTVWVVAFNPSTLNKKWVEKIPGSQITNNGQASQLLPQLKNTPENGDLIVCIAHVDPNPDTTTVTYNTINNCFKLDINDYYIDAEYLPMYGEMTWSSSSGYICTMTRAVAKIQVQMGTSVSDVTGNFTEKNVSFRVNNLSTRGTIQPGPGGTVLGIGMHYTDPDPLRYNRYDLFNYLIQKDTSIFLAGHTRSLNHSYLYEYPASTNTARNGTPVSNTVFHADRTHILLEKINAPADTTFYRLDFYDSKNKTYLDIKRNHNYIFTINKVRSEGYKDRYMAITNHGSNIEYTVIVEDDSKFVKSNGQYAIITSTMDTVYVSSTGTQTIATARYHLPSGVTLGSGTPNSITTSGSGLLSIILPTALSNTDQNIRPTILSVTPGVKVGEVVFNLGNITHKIVIMGE